MKRILAYPTFHDKDVNLNASGYVDILEEILNGQFPKLAHHCEWHMRFIVEAMLWQNEDTVQTRFYEKLCVRDSFKRF